MKTHRKTRWAVLAVLVIVVACAAVYFGDSRVRNFVHPTHSSAPSGSTGSSGSAVTTLDVSAAQLVSTGLTLNRPIYWIGASGTPTTYELTYNGAKEVFVRYLPVGVKVGSPNAYLAIGTYPMPNAFAVTTKLAEAADAVKLNAPQSAVAFYLKARPENVYLAFPGSSYQVEVFDPSAALAQQIVQFGLVSNASTKAVNITQAVTAEQLTGYAHVLAQPVYWLGPKANDTYELTRTTDGRVYVRYLPAGVAIGSRHAYLTVGTYPMTNAYAITRKLAATGVKIKTAANTVALSLKAKPTSVYIAFTGLNFQVEVYDPTAAAGHRIVAAGQVQNAG